MTDAPKRIWASRNGLGLPCWQTSKWDGAPEYHLARPRQPCSTDEFLLMSVRKHAYGDYALNERLQEWLSGDFTAAMDGLV